MRAWWLAAVVALACGTQGTAQLTRPRLTRTAAPTARNEPPGTESKRVPFAPGPSLSRLVLAPEGFAPSDLGRPLDANFVPIEGAPRIGTQPDVQQAEPELRITAIAVDSVEELAARACCSRACTAW